ncbi:MAG: class I SAM-dependent methyltransferase [Candidatus Villigracilaceae bacterium]
MLRLLFFNLRYLRRPRWDSGLVPPELTALIGQLPPGRALDLGCGTGTSSLVLAQAGWDVTGVDFAGLAIYKARRKARNAGQNIRFLLADVTHLPDFDHPFELVLDIGCFHGLTDEGRTAYLSQLERLIAPGGYWFLYTFLHPDETVHSAPGVCSSDLEFIQTRFRLLSRQDGLDHQRPSAYFLFQK